MKRNASPYVIAVLAALSFPALGHAGALKDAGRLLGDEVQRHEDRQQLHEDRQTRRQDTKEFVRDVIHGNVGGAVDDLRNIHQDNRDVHQDRRDLADDRRDIHDDKRRLDRDF
jgi:hypothetical protein